VLEEPQGTISPNIYGHFEEHLGGVIYDGWRVGPKSNVPNVDGLRHDVIEHMKNRIVHIFPAASVSALSIQLR
jgi:alpha-L-arabinofuranosidase